MFFTPKKLLLLSLAFIFTSGTLFSASGLAKKNILKNFFLKLAPYYNEPEDPLLKNACLAQDFDVLDKDSVLKTVLYLRAAPEVVENYPSLIAILEQQMKPRKAIMAILKEEGLDLAESHLANDLFRGFVARFTTSIIAAVSAGKYWMPDATSLAISTGRSLYYGSILQAQVNPNSFRFVNFSLPCRYQTFTHQMIDCIPSGIIEGLCQRFIAPSVTTKYLRGEEPTRLEIQKSLYALAVEVAITMVYNYFIMKWYVSSSRTQALRELKEIEDKLPKSVVNEVAMLIESCHAA